MNEQNDFERQVEREEQAQYSEPKQEACEKSTGTVDDIVEKVKEFVKKGNVTNIVIKKDDKILVNIPLNVGIVGGIIGVAAAPWAIVAAAVATAGFACKVELVDNAGEVVEVNGKAAENTARDLGKTVEDKARDIGEAAKDFGTAVMDGIKIAVSGEEAVEADFESVVDEAEKSAEDKPEE